MREIKLTLSGIPQLAGIALSMALVVLLVLAAAAHAQSPADDQYKERPVPSGPALGAAGVPVGEAKSSQANAGGGSKTQPPGPKASVLPATGGPMLLVYAGGLAASGLGLLLLRRFGRGR